MKNIQGKTVLLTGASGGIGSAIAHSLAREKVKIIALARSPSQLNILAPEIQALGSEIQPISWDISDITSLKTLIDRLDRDVGTIDILINNAGIEIYRAFPDYNTTELQAIFNTNLLSSMELTRLLLPKMLQRESGHIVNIASLAGKKAPAYNSIYAASKAGLLLWSDGLRQELAGTDVEISVICPGYVAGKGMFAATKIPAPRFSGTSEPQDVARAVIRAIKTNRAETIVNQNTLTEASTKLLLILSQLFPRFGDRVFRWLGVTRLNQRRI